MNPPPDCWVLLGKLAAKTRNSGNRGAIGDPVLQRTGANPRGSFYCTANVCTEGIVAMVGTSWYIMVLCVPYLVSFGDYLRGKIESKIGVKCALATACCLGPLGKPLDVCPFCNGCKKGISKHPRSEAQKPACLS